MSFRPEMWFRFELLDRISQGPEVGQQLTSFHRGPIYAFVQEVFVEQLAYSRNSCILWDRSVDKRGSSGCAPGVCPLLGS